MDEMAKDNSTLRASMQVGPCRRIEARTALRFVANLDEPMTDCSPLQKECLPS